MWNAECGIFDFRFSIFDWALPRRGGGGFFGILVIGIFLGFGF
jgi:hypothetical protein